MLHLFLEKADFVGSEGEEAIDVVVEFGLGGGEGAGQAGVLGEAFLEIGLPLVGGAWVLHGV